jgi:hypothetical protein
VALGQSIYRTFKYSILSQSSNAVFADHLTVDRGREGRGRGILNVSLRRRRSNGGMGGKGVEARIRNIVALLDRLPEWSTRERRLRRENYRTLTCFGPVTVLMK